MINLLAMKEVDFVAYKEYALADFTSLDRVGTWKNKEEANDRFTETFPKGLQTDGLICFVVSKGSERIGFIIVKTIKRAEELECFILDLMIEENYRRQGYGKEALQFLKHWAAEHSYHRIGLSVLPNNLAAKSLYETMGFEVDFIRMGTSLA